MFIPPLRERIEDLPLLLDHYVELFSQKSGKEKPSVTREVLDYLSGYPWPGNIRELRNVIERAIILDQDQKITPEDVALPEKEITASKEVYDRLEGNFHDLMEHYKRSLIEAALKKTEGNQTKAAKLLGLQRTYFSRLIRQLNISGKD